MGSNTEDAAALKRMREAARLTLAEAATLLGVTQAKYKNLEYGKTKIPGQLIVEASLKFAREDPIVAGLAGQVPYVGVVPGVLNWPEVNDETNESFWNLRKSMNAMLPLFLARKNRYLVEIADPYETQDIRLEPGRDTLVVQGDRTVRPGRLSIMVSAEDSKMFRASHGASLPVPYEVMGYVVAVLRDFGSSHGTLFWDESGIIA